MATGADLERLIGAPIKAAPNNDWQSIESELGLRLPRDYKELMGRYANLELDSFQAWYIPNPGCYPHTSMRELALNILGGIGPAEDEELEVVDDDKRIIESRYFAHYPEPGGIIPWGSTQNGQLGLWESSGDPDSWKVCISDGTFLWRHSQGLVDFLVQANMGTIKCPLLARNGALDGTKREYTQADLET